MINKVLFLALFIVLVNGCTGGGGNSRSDSSNENNDTSGTENINTVGSAPPVDETITQEESKTPPASDSTDTDSGDSSSDGSDSDNSGSDRSNSNSDSDTGSGDGGTDSGAGSGISVPADDGTVTLAGKVTFDLVPNSATGALDYLSTTREPGKGLTVQLINSANDIISSTNTDSAGEFSFSVDANQLVRVRILSEIKQDGPASYDFQVRDNTSSNALYALDGSLVSSGSTNSRREIHAASGWDGSSYSAQRAAAPFAILDAVYEALQYVLAADDDVVLPEADILWSEKNKAIPGDPTIGEITTAYFDTRSNNIYLLGDENNDTDEYDRSVIQHEWTHYFEFNMSRSNSIGGSHHISEKLDMRVAFGEGFANAFSGIVGKKAFYFDAIGNRQAVGGARISLEDTNNSNRGFFSENSIGLVVYDLFDSTNEAGDDITLSFEQLYNTITAPNYVSKSALTSIYSFSHHLSEILNASEKDAFEALLDQENIFGRGPYGEGESFDGDVEFALPVYQSLSPGQSINLCSGAETKDYNGIDVRRFVRLNVTEAGEYIIRINGDTSSPLNNKRPEAVLYKDGRFLDEIISSNSDSVAAVADYQVGEYILEVYENRNVDNISITGGTACFDVSFSAN